MGEVLEARASEGRASPILLDARRRLNRAASPPALLPLAKPGLSPTSPTLGARSPPGARHALALAIGHGAQPKPRRRAERLPRQRLPGSPPGPRPGGVEGGGVEGGGVAGREAVALGATARGQVAAADRLPQSRVAPVGRGEGEAVATAAAAAAAEAEAKAEEKAEEKAVGEAALEEVAEEAVASIEEQALLLSMLEQVRYLVIIPTIASSGGCSRRPDLCHLVITPSCC